MVVILSKMLDEPDLELRTEVAEGLCKLLMIGSIRKASSLYNAYLSNSFMVPGNKMLQREGGGIPCIFNRLTLVPSTGGGRFSPFPPVFFLSFSRKKL